MASKKLMRGRIRQAYRGGMSRKEIAMLTGYKISSIYKITKDIKHK